jgi:hypothetical protein
MLYTRQKLYDVQPARVIKKGIHWSWAVMELVEGVLTYQQRELLQLKKSAREDINNFDNVLKVAAYNIESQAFERMKALDGKTASQTKPTMTGLGCRYIQYCKKNRVATKKGKSSKQMPPKDPTQTGLFGFLLKPSRHPRRRNEEWVQHIIYRNILYIKYFNHVFDRI